MEKNNEEEPEEPGPSDRAKPSGEDNDTASEMTAMFVFEPHVEETLPQQLDIAHAQNLLFSSWYSGSRHADNSALPVDNNNKENDSEGTKHEETRTVPEQENIRRQATQNITGSDPADFQSTRPAAINQRTPVERLFLDDQKEQEIEEWLDEQPHWPR